MKNNLQLPLFFCLALVILTGFSHKYYLSLCQIEHNVTNHSLEISLKVFTNDLERCVGKHSRENLHLGEPSEHNHANELLLKYFNEKLIFKNNNQPLEMRWIGKEVGVEETWCYIEVMLPSADLKSVDIENRMFTEVFSTQINLVKFVSAKTTAQDFNFSKTEFKGTILLQ